tara:strand:- start:289 stop:627 length:339 start_codon:yes stop_codon:yes gene_type:complete
MQKKYYKDQLTLAIINRLKNNENISQRALAGDLNVSIGSVNYCLRALVEKGFVKVQNFRKSNNKLSYAYILTPKGISEKFNLTRLFLKRKQNEYQFLQEEIKLLKKELKGEK